MTARQQDGKWQSLSEQARKSAEEFPSLLHASSLFVVLALYRAFSVLDRDQSAELTAVDLDPRQFNVLAVLHRAGEPIPMRALSQMVAVQPTNLTGIVESLFKFGFIKRQTNPKDRRSLLVTTSAKGEKFLQGFFPGHWEHMEKIMSGLTETDRKNLVRLLRMLVQSIETSDEG